MKFATLFALIATAAAVRISDPKASAAARESTLATSRSVVATQNKFEADHLNMHTNNMNTAQNECQTLKTSVRLARARMVAGGDQTPAMKKY